VEDDHYPEWFSPTGKLLWSTLSEPLDIPIHPNRTGETVQVVRSKESGQQEQGRKPSPLRLFCLRQVTERVQIGRRNRLSAC